MRRRQFLESGLVGTGAVLLGVPRLRAEADGFTHDVASGDPKRSGFTAWTRYCSSDGADARLTVEIAADESFRTIVARGEAVASRGNDYCAKVRTDGLAAGRSYFYRFAAPNGACSSTGRSRTLPQGPTDHFRIAVVSCSNATSGWFNAYAHLATREDIDLVIHLGDYIYESPIDRPDALPGLAAKRGIAPAHEAVTLDDYRLRYSSYRQDPDLRALHRRLPVIVMMDDHESANNSWQNGAAGHDPVTEGAWRTRKAAALKAFHEWMPGNGQLFDRFDIGDLASIFRLETRLLGRSRQIDLDEAVSGAPEANFERFRAQLDTTNRTMLGTGQEAWLAEALHSSAASGIAWQILAQQVIMARRRFPLGADAWLKAPDIIPLERGNARYKERIAFLTELSERGLPYGMDKWDGYPTARRRLYQSARDAKAELVVLSGDSHNSWAFNLADQGGPVGVEFATTSVSSFGFDKRFSGNYARMEGDFINANPDLVWCDLSRRGFLLLDLHKDRAIGEWHYVDSGDRRTTRVSGHKAFVTERGSNVLQPT